jgi:hypothetical protein
MSETSINNEPDIKPDRVRMKWETVEDKSLYDAFTDDFDLNEIARRHRRQRGGIRSRLRHLGLTDSLNTRVVPKPPFTPKTTDRDGPHKERAGIKLFRKINKKQHRTILKILQAFAAGNNGNK